MPRYIDTTLREFPFSQVTKIRDTDDDAQMFDIDAFIDSQESNERADDDMRDIQSMIWQYSTGRARARNQKKRVPSTKK